MMSCKVAYVDHIMYVFKRQIVCRTFRVIMFRGGK